MGVDHTHTPTYMFLQAAVRKKQKDKLLESDRDGPMSMSAPETARGAQGDKTPESPPESSLIPVRLHFSVIILISHLSRARNHAKHVINQNSLNLSLVMEL